MTDDWYAQVSAIWARAHDMAELDVVAAIDELVARAEAHPEAGAFGPRINDAGGTLYPSARKLPSLRTGIGHVLFVKPWPTSPKP